MYSPISAPAASKRRSRRARGSKGEKAAAATKKRRKAKPKGSVWLPASLTQTQLVDTSSTSRFCVRGGGSCA